MSKRNDLNSIGQVYGNMLNKIKKTIVSEDCKVSPKVPVGQIGDAPLLCGGPQEKGGFKKVKLDKKKLSDKEKKDNLYDIDNLSEEDEEVLSVKTNTEITKIAKQSINNFMKRKSIFDKLYENVMPGGSPMGDDMSAESELDALGIGSDSDDGEEMNFDDEEGGDEVTFTLDRETAKKLRDVLVSCCGDDEEGADDDMFSDEDSDMGGNDDMGGDDFSFDEDEEELGHAGSGAKEPNMGKNNKVGNLKVQSGGASSAYTDKVGNDGDHGHALHGAKQPNMGKNNKVGNLKPGSKSAFEQ